MVPTTESPLGRCSRQLLTSSSWGPGREVRKEIKPTQRRPSGSVGGLFTTAISISSYLAAISFVIFSVVVKKRNKNDSECTEAISAGAPEEMQEKEKAGHAQLRLKWIIELGLIDIVIHHKKMNGLSCKSTRSYKSHWIHYTHGSITMQEFTVRVRLDIETAAVSQ